MNFILDLILQSVSRVWQTLMHNWPYLLASVVVAVLLKRYLDAARISAFLKRYRSAGVVAATAAAVTTPLCSCGTTAVVLGMMASMIPWAPIVAFMVSSPLTSPEGLIYNAGLFGWPFSIAFYTASILLGLSGGGIAAWLESRGLLENQNRFASPAPASIPAAAECACSGAPSREAAAPGVPFLGTPSLALVPSTTGCGCGGPVSVQTAECGCGQTKAAAKASGKLKMDVPALLKEAFLNGKQLLLMFLGFAFIGYFLNGLIPEGWVSALFGGENIYSVPLAATLGLPLYINSEASLPLIRALLDHGMSQGAALAFLIAGAGTSIGAVAGALAIARWRVVALVIGVLWAGAILSGFAYNLLLTLHLF